MTLFKPLSAVSTELQSWATADHTRIPTGFDFIDSLTQGGAAEGEVVLLMAYSGVGKTAIGCNMALVDPTIPTIFFSLEMQGRFILKRLAAIYSQTPDRLIEQQLRAGEPCPAIEVLLRDFPFLAIVDKPGMSLKEMSAVVKEAGDFWGVKPRRVVIDYMELVGGVPSLEAVTGVDKVSRRTKDFAREHDTVTVMLHQLNQGGESYKPVNVKNARYGGNVAADYVIAAYRPCMDPELSPHMYEALKNQMMVQFLKTRGGPDIHPSGVEHFYNTDTMQISPVQREFPEIRPIPQLALAGQ